MNTIYFYCSNRLRVPTDKKWFTSEELLADFAYQIMKEEQKPHIIIPGDIIRIILSNDAINVINSYMSKISGWTPISGHHCHEVLRFSIGSDSFLAPLYRNLGFVIKISPQVTGSWLGNYLVPTLIIDNPFYKE